MTSTTKKPSQETMRRLEAAEKKMRELEAATTRRLVEPVIAEAIADGRIGRDEETRWFERAETFGFDVCRDLIRERRPDRRLAAENASGSRFDVLSDGQKAEVATAFGLRPEDL